MPGSALSNAALAAGPTRPLDRDHDLRIGAGPVPAGPESLGGGPAAISGPGTGAQLRPPEPVAQPVSRTQTNPVPAAPASLPRPLGSYEDALGQLRARGVTWQRLEQLPQGEGWKFSCSLPNAQNARLQHRYEARASDYLSAVKAVLDQIDKETAARPGT